MQSHNLLSSSYRLTCALALLTAVGACTSSVTAPPRHPPGGFDLRGLEAFGEPQHAARVASAPADLTAYLKPVTVAQESAKTNRPAPKLAKEQHIARANAPAVAKPSRDPSTTIPAAAITLNEPLASDADAARYSARDREAKKQKAFRGGDALVITSGTVVLILLVVLLILLLT